MINRIIIIIITLKKTLDTHAPQQNMTKNETKLYMKPWLTKGIITSAKKKRKLFRKFKEYKLKNYDIIEIIADK